jgi:hypothetical protein
VSLTITEIALLHACRGEFRELPLSEWQDVLALAEIHEVIPVVAYNIRRYARRTCGTNAFVPAEVVERAEKVHALCVIQQGLIISEISTVVNEMRDLAPIVIKGPGLAALYYPAGARLSRDLDILIPSSDYYRARAALTRLGYSVMVGYDERIQRLKGKDVAFSRNDATDLTWSVELHWRLSEPGGPEPSAGLPRHSRLTEYGGASFMVPGVEHTLLVLALNLRKQRFARLKTVVDIAQVLRAEENAIDWTFLHEEAHAAGMCGLLRHALALADRMMSAPVGVLPPCHRTHSPMLWALSHVATPDSVLREGRRQDRSAAFAGLIPFFSLDKSASALHLAYDRLMLSPELASYYRSGAPGVYRSRRQYWQDTTHRFMRAVQTLAESG